MTTKLLAESAENRNQPRAARPVDRPVSRTALGASASPVEPLWDVRDVAAFLKLPVSAIYKMTAKRAAVRIPHIHIGGAVRFRRADIDRWLTTLTISNIATLARMRNSVAEVTHGHDP